MDTLLTIYGISIIPSAIACHFIAKARGGNPVEWGIIGVFWGFLAIPFVFCCKQKK